MSRELREQIEAAAQKNRRSLNAEIVDRLEESFREAEVRSDLAVARLLNTQPWDSPTEERIQKLEQELQKLKRQVDMLQC